MRYSTEHKELTRKKILDAAATRFRAEGYDGLGIDALAKAAGVTNGAFYGHFASKADAYREIVVRGLADLRAGIAAHQAEHGTDWVRAFARFYFGQAKRDYVENLCALPAFGGEAARAPAPTRAAFEQELRGVQAALAAGLAGADADIRAWRMLGIMVGGITLARAVPDAALAEQLAETYEAALVAAAGPSV
jgi:TetR/AcrR family transcriptional regulator, transcriptional repressor for nem operon